MTAREVTAATTLADIGRLLRELRRREARLRGDTVWTYRELAEKAADDRLLAAPWGQPAKAAAEP